MTFTPRAYAHDPSAPSYGLEAAQALGVEAGRVFKTLVVQSGDGKDGLAVAIVPVDRQVDLKAMAQALGVKRVRLADPALAERVTGYVVGAISPVGQKRRLPTVLDEAATAHATVLVSGGRRGFEVELAPADLLAVTAGRTAPIAQ